MLSAKPWRGETVIWFCAAQLASLCVGLTLIGVLQKAGFTAFQPLTGAGAIVVSTLAFQGATWVLIYLFLRMHHVRCRDEFGLQRAKWNRIWFPALSVAMASVLLTWLVQYACIYVLTKAGLSPGTETAVTVLTNAKEGWLRVYLGVFTVVIAPVAEEFIFRGMLYPFVKQAGWPRLAWVGVNFLFAVVHWNATALVPLFLLGLVLTWLYERTDSLLAPITAHAFFNAVNLVVLCLFQSEIRSGQP
jgi:membrane protease YdiL (CAAX protease family)